MFPTKEYVYVCVYVFSLKRIDKLLIWFSDIFLFYEPKEIDILLLITEPVTVATSTF